MGRDWMFKNVYTAQGITMLRACTLMPVFFVTLDSFRRNFDEFFKFIFQVFVH